MADKERGVLGQLVRGLSLLVLIILYAGGIFLTYRQLRSQTPAIGVLNAPEWTYAALVLGLIICGGLGVAAAVVDGRRETPSWVIALAGTVAALAWSLWAVDSQGKDAVGMLFAATPPLTAFLVLMELMRQLRAKRRSAAAV
ncbi:hypothetical protein [Streptomyces sp. NPDC052496]|uniref:hypothetical protein n=1 Tax=Streptomyces sp. NPDC052496 TaxID=3154951 RepID=UPI00343748AE